MLIRDKLLSKRLATIYDMVEHGDSIADIGTDHGYLIVALALDKKTKQVYGVDNKSAPLSQAKKTITDANLQNDIELTLVKEEHAYHHVDGWVIAGMGYETIASIIRQFYETIKKLKYVIVQANHQIEEFRRFCVANHLEIIDEQIVFDQHYYQILKVKYTPLQVSYTESELLLGPKLLENKVPPFIDYCEHKIRILEDILKKLPKDGKKAHDMQKQLELYKNQITEDRKGEYYATK